MAAIVNKEKQEMNEKTSVKRIETNEVFIGNKPFMKYVVATMMQLKENNSAVIKARGKFVSRGVDVAEVAKKRLKEIENTELSDSVKIGTDSFKNEDGKEISVSTIEISLLKR